MANTKYKEGQIIGIYQKWQTKEDFEGDAVLLHFEFSEEDFEYWTVRFLADDFKAGRFILK